jgi:hypothetical protein
LFKGFFLTVLLVFGLTACQSNRQKGSGAGKVQSLDGFKEQNYQGLLSAVKLEKNRAQALRFESEWLKLRTQVVLAESYASDCRLSELELSAKMSQFGSLNQKLSEDGFITVNQRKHWNAQLEVKKTNRINAEARANLLRRDLHDLRQEITKSGYKVAGGAIISPK